MYCNKCGKQISDNSIFCNYCGVKIELPTQNKEPQSKEELIIEACKDCVKKRLKAPSTVNFNVIEIKDKDNYGRIYLYVEVDAQNSFGAMIRSTFIVEFSLTETKEKTTAHLEYLQIDDSTYGTFIDLDAIQP